MPKCSARSYIHRKKILSLWITHSVLVNSPRHDNKPCKALCGIYLLHLLLKYPLKFSTSLLTGSLGGQAVCGGLSLPGGRGWGE